MDSRRGNPSPSDPKESACRQLAPHNNHHSSLLKIYSQELTSGVSGCSWPSSIGLRSGALDNPHVRDERLSLVAE